MNAIKAHPWLAAASLLTAAKTAKNLWYDREWKDYTSLQICLVRNLLQIPVVTAIAYGTFRLMSIFNVDASQKYEASVIYIFLGIVLIPVRVSVNFDKIVSVIMKVSLAAISLLLSACWLSLFKNDNDD